MLTGRFQPPSRQAVFYGKPAAEALREAMKEFWVTTAVLVTNTSLSRPGGLADEIVAAMGDACTNVVSGVRANSPREDVIRIAEALRSKGVEAVVALGGGSVVEAVKAARISVTNNVRDAADMDRLKRTTTAATPRPYLISLPTTLSAAEFTQFAGITDERSGVKDAFHHPDLAPDAVILDPEVTLATPADLWLSTGMRAIDHAVETWCAKSPTPFSDATALYAARKLARALPRTKSDPEDREARLDCQIGAWMSIQGATVGVSHGASHGIGHGLSAVTGMTHGVTSCIMLPHVLRYNAAVDAQRQAVLAEAMGGGGRLLADFVSDLVRDLGMPTRLRDAGVREEQLATVADAAMRNPRVATNIRPFDENGMMQVLGAAY